MLKFEGLNIGVGKRNLFQVDSLELTHGIVALVGRNGAGKSTFFRTIMGLNQAYSGAIYLQNKSIKNHTQAELAKQIAIVYSKSTLFGNHTGRDVLYLGRLPYQNVLAQKKEGDHQHVQDAIDLLDLSAFVDRIFVTLSDGEKQLVMIGRALVQNTPLMILDEPGAFLDLVNRYKVMEVLKKIAEQTHKLILFSTHEIDFLPALCSSVLLIEENKLVHLTEKSAYIRKIRTSFGIENSDV